MGTRGARALEIVRSPASWQRCIHGGEQLFREEVCEQLLHISGEKGAFRYAACGLADSVVKCEGGARVQPMGCGHRLCPRCGRASGRPMIRRILSWLGTVDHGDLFTMVLTQKVIEGESLVAARKRMVGKQRRYLDRLKAAGLMGGALTTHIVWSQRSNGWHYHVHLLLELPGGTFDTSRLLEMWAQCAAPEWVQTGADSSRLISPAGGPILALQDDDGQPDLWTESANAVVRAVQYPVRDIAQGVSAARCGGDRERVRECVATLLKFARGWKLKRTLGRWRKPPPVGAAAVVEPKEGASGSTAAAPAPAEKPERVGSVHRLAREARKGAAEARELFRLLERSVSNNTDFGRRFVLFCRSCSADPPLGGSSDVQV